MNFFKIFLNLNILGGNKLETLNSKIKNYFAWDKCNSYNRYTCDIQTTLMNEINQIRNDNQNAHLYYKSPSCVREVLSSDFNLINILIILFISIILF